MAVANVSLSYLYNYYSCQSQIIKIASCTTGININAES